MNHATRKIPGIPRVFSSPPFSIQIGSCVEARLILFIAHHKINTPIGQLLPLIGYLAVTEPNCTAPSLHPKEGVVKFGSVEAIMAVSSTTILTGTHD
jgi:hypothetical protein